MGQSADASVGIFVRVSFISPDRRRVRPWRLKCGVCPRVSCCYLPSLYCCRRHRRCAAPTPPLRAPTPTPPPRHRPDASSAPTPRAPFAGAARWVGRLRAYRCHLSRLPPRLSDSPSSRRLDRSPELLKPCSLHLRSLHIAARQLGARSSLGQRRFVVG